MRRPLIAGTAACLLVVLCVVLACLLLAYASQHAAVDNQGTFHWCRTLEIGFWDNFYPDGTWKEGGQNISCDGLEWRTSSRCEAQDLYGASCR